MSLTGIYDDANVFAKILRGEMPAVKVYEDTIALAFMDVFPQVRGHTLIIPKHATARNFLELPPAEIGPYMQIVQRVAQAVVAGLEPDGVRVMTFNGAPAGQTIFHLHFHIMPIWAGHRVKPHAEGQRADLGELQELAAKIAGAM